MVAVNPNTVFKAYHYLKHDGLVEGRTGVGTFVLRRPAGLPPETQAKLGRTLRRWVGSARKAGLDNESIESLVRSTLDQNEGEAPA